MDIVKIFVRSPACHQQQAGSAAASIVVTLRQGPSVWLLGMKYTKHSELVPVYGGGGNKIHRDHPNAIMNLEKYAMDGKATPSQLRAMGFQQDHVAGWKMNFVKDRFERSGFSSETIPQPGTRSKNGAFNRDKRKQIW